MLNMIMEKKRLAIMRPLLAKAFKENAEMFVGNILNNYSPKKTLMSTIVDKIKYLTMSAEKKLLLKYGIEDKEGNLMEAGKEAVVQKAYEAYLPAIIEDLKKIEASEEVGK